MAIQSFPVSSGSAGKTAYRLTLTGGSFFTLPEITDLPTE
jgi:hypothetical protein